MEGVLEQLQHETLAALRVSGADWPRGMFSAPAIPEGWLGLQEFGDGRRVLLPPGEQPRVNDDDVLTLVRSRPLTVVVDVSAAAADGHGVDAQVELHVRVSANADELASFGRRLLVDAASLQEDDLRRVVVSGGAETGLRGLLGSQPAEHLVGRVERGVIETAMRKALQPLLFESGLVLERVARAAFSSDTLTRVRERSAATSERLEQIAARERIEAASAAAAARRLDDLGALLTKLREAASADDDIRWHALLPVLTPAERARLLENLWRLAPQTSSASSIVAVVGQELVWVAPEAPDELRQRRTLPDALGALRSVRCAPDGELLVGAATGVWCIPDGGEPIALRAATEKQPRTGFNSAVRIGAHVFATHSQLGCWQWRTDDEDGGPQLVAACGDTVHSVRAATALDDGRLVFAVERCLHFYTPETNKSDVLSPASSTIYSLGATGRALYAGTGAGRLLRCDLHAPGFWTTVHQAVDPIESLAVRHWNDLVEVVIPTGEGGVCGVFGDEAAVTRLMPSSTRIRRVWASAGVIAALTAARDKLIVMTADQAGRTPREAPLARLTGRSIQDACVVSRGASA